MYTYWRGCKGASDAAAGVKPAPCADVHLTRQEAAGAWLIRLAEARPRRASRRGESPLIRALRRRVREAGGGRSRRATSMGRHETSSVGGGG